MARPIPPSDAGPRLYLLGTPRLAIGQDIWTLERKDAALLALLELEAPVARSRAAMLLWPDVDEERGRNSLRQRLFRMRRTLGRNVVVAHGVLQLEQDVDCDLALARRQLSDDPAAGSGELLGDFGYDDCPALSEWVAVAREQWRAARRDAVAEIAARLEGEGRLARALLYAERLVADEPLLEHTHRRLMRLHYLRGDRAAALAAFERCRGMLARELRAHPGRETLDLASLIERGSAPLVAAPPPAPLAVLRPPRLIGRDADWAALEHAWVTGRSAIVSGEPGIGKTRLLSDFARHHAAAVPVAARPGDARVPYALLARLLRAALDTHGRPDEEWIVRELAHVAPELGTAAGRLQTLRLRQAALAAFAGWAAAGLVAVFVDDLHFADEATLELLPALSTPGTNVPRWFFGVRSSEVPRLVADWIGAADDTRLAQVVLGPLDGGATRSLLESLALPGLDPSTAAPALHRHTGGNPLLLLETLRALLQRDAGLSTLTLAKLELPAQVGQLIEHRLMQLSSQALRLARVAALAGQDFSVALAAHVLDCHALDLAEPWRELEGAQVIREQAFAHDLVFEATVRSVPAPIARELHRAIAVWLGAGQTPAARVAVHWERAEAWREAGAAFERAALAAFDAARRAEEAQLYERAAQCYEHAQLGRKAFAARCAGVGAVLVAQPHERADALTQQLLANAADDDQRLDALLERANVLLTIVRTDEAAQAADQALALARSTGQPMREFDAARLVALLLSQQQRVTEAMALLEGFESLIEASADLRRRYRYWSDLSYLLQIADRRARCAQALEISIDLAQQLGDLGEVVVGTSNLSAVYGYLGRPADAFALALRAHGLCQRLGDTESIASASVDVHVGMFALLLGRYAQSLRHLEEATRKALLGGGVTWRAVSENHLANAYLHLGQVARARRVLTPVSSDALASVRARRAAIEGRIERGLGRPGQARFRDALSLLGPEGDPLNRMLAELDLSRELPPAEAAELCRQVQQRAERHEHAGVALKAQLLHVEALVRAGEAGPAGQEAHRLLAELQDLRPVDMYWPECTWLAWQALAAHGAADEANAVLAGAVDWIEQAALPQVPPEFRDGFLHRQPVNRAILTTASRVLRR